MVQTQKNTEKSCWELSLNKILHICTYTLISKVVTTDENSFKTSLTEKKTSLETSFSSAENHHIVIADPNQLVEDISHDSNSTNNADLEQTLGEEDKKEPIDEQTDESEENGTFNDSIPLINTENGDIETETENPIALSAQPGETDKISEDDPINELSTETLQEKILEHRNIVSDNDEIKTSFNDLELNTTEIIEGHVIQEGKRVSIVDRPLNDLEDAKDFTPIVNQAVQENNIQDENSKLGKKYSQTGDSQKTERKTSQNSENRLSQKADIVILKNSKNK